MPDGTGMDLPLNWDIKSHRRQLKLPSESCRTKRHRACGQQLQLNGAPTPFTLSIHCLLSPSTVNPLTGLTIASEPSFPLYIEFFPAEVLSVIFVVDSVDKYNTVWHVILLHLHSQ